MSLVFVHAIARPCTLHSDLFCASLCIYNGRKISAHYNLHVVDPVLQRTNAVRELGKMREFQAQCLLRVNPDGTKTLDQKSAELMLKLVALSDKQIQALDAARMPPPPPRTR